MKRFQMRIMHRILWTNVILNEMGVTNNNRCSFCLIAKDNTTHILGKYIQPTVLDMFLVFTEWEMYLLLQIKTECLILFWIDDGIKTENVFDFILLLAKQYQYKCNIEKQLLNINIFRKQLLYRYKQRNIMLRHSSFSSRWEPYNLFLQANVLNKKCPRIHTCK